MNRYSFIGHLGQDAKTTALSAGGNVIAFSVAVTEKWKDKDGNEKTDTTWVACSWFRRANDSVAIAQYLKKGTKVLVEGKPKARAYADKEQYAAASLDVTVQTVELHGSPTEGGNTASTGSGERPKVKTPGENGQENNAGANSADDGASDDLPF